MATALFTPTWVATTPVPPFSSPILPDLASLGGSHTPPPLSHQHTTEKVATFVHSLQEKTGHSLSSLQTVLDKLMEGDPEMRQALRKKEGYFHRLFSKESWEEWTQDKTPLGELIARIADYINGSKKALKYCDPALAIKANREAQTLLAAKNHPPASGALQQPLWTRLWDAIQAVDRTVTAWFTIPGALAEAPPATTTQPPLVALAPCDLPGAAPIAHRAHTCNQLDEQCIQLVRAFAQDWLPRIIEYRKTDAYRHCIAEPSLERRLEHLQSEHRAEQARHKTCAEKYPTEDGHYSVIHSTPPEIRAIFASMGGRCVEYYVVDKGYYGWQVYKNHPFWPDKLRCQGGFNYDTKQDKPAEGFSYTPC